MSSIRTKGSRLIGQPQPYGHNIKAGDFLKNASEAYPYHVDKVDDNGVAATQATPMLRSMGALPHETVRDMLQSGKLSIVTNKTSLKNAQYIWDHPRTLGKFA